MVKREFEADIPQRLDQALAQRWPQLDRWTIHEAVRNGAVTVNGRRATSGGQRLDAGDRVHADLPEAPATPDLHPALLPPRILYRDEAVLVVDKPAGVPLFPSPEEVRESLADILIADDPAIANVGGAGRAGIVTAMEDGVSGLILAGRDEAAYRRLKRALGKRQIERRYTALVEGVLKGEGTIDLPIGRQRHERGRQRVSRTGRAAITRYRVLTGYRLQGRSYTLVELQPESGRRHQLRIHLAWYGTPIVGDRVYGSRRQEWLDDRLFLHLSALTFRHPQSGDRLTFRSPLPKALDSLLRYLRHPRR